MEEFYIHSKCCNSHWELVVRGDNFSLQCENCGKDIGPSVQVIGSIEKKECACCGSKGRGGKNGKRSN